MANFLENSLSPDFNNIKLDLWNHKGWKPVNKNSYIISSFREPVSRLISHFCFILFIHNLNKKDKKHNLFFLHPTNRVKDVNNPTVEEFLNWIEKNKEILCNYQAKNFSYNEKDNGVPTFLQALPVPLRLRNFDKKETFDNILNVNILLKTEHVTEKNMVNVVNKIFNDFEIKNNLNTDKIIKQVSDRKNINSKSLELFNKLTKKDISYLQDLNSIDMEIYNTDSFFWDSSK